jgi:hypothetical protein
MKLRKKGKLLRFKGGKEIDNPFYPYKGKLIQFKAEGYIIVITDRDGRPIDVEIPEGPRTLDELRDLAQFYADLNKGGAVIAKLVESWQYEEE